MSRSSLARLALLALAAVGAAPCLAEQRASARDFAAAALVAPPRTSWPTNGGDLYNQRYSPLAQLNRANVAALKGVWRTHLRGSGLGQQYSGEAQLLVYDGVAYVVTGADDVFAISIDSGEILWQYEAHLDPNLTSVCCGWTSRGVAVSADKVFVGRLDARLIALDRATGKVAWDVQAERWEENFDITSAPLYYDGMVITGFAGADRGTRGRVKAFDAKSGRLLWTFYTIPGPGEPGHETWPRDSDVWKYGGGSVWQTPAVDPELGLLPIVGIDEQPVPQEPGQATAATQPIPRGDAIVPQHVEIAPEGVELVHGGRIFTPFLGLDEGTLVKPSLWGGANWPPSSYDPERQTLFVCASSVVGYLKGGVEEFHPPAQGERYLGGIPGYAALPRTGIFAAVDMTTNKLVWRYRWPEQCYSGSIATGGGLVFVGRNDGRLTALDSGTGKQLWEFQTGAGMHAPVSTFEHKGKQYVIAYSAGNALIGSARGDSVWLLGLDGTLPPAERQIVAPRTSSVAAQPQAAPATAALAAADVANGERLFKEACAICHGDDGKGGHGGGAPLDRVTDLAAAIQTIGSGRNSMPAFGATLAPEQIRDVGAYVVQRLAGAVAR